MEGLRSFIEADNHSAVDVGDLRRGTKSLPVKNRSLARPLQRRPSEEQMS